jgi:Kdo2-lipid IVA lauroyltransferase/acyltransferase
MARRADRSPTHPLLWPTWAGVGALWLVSRLPWSWQRGLAAAVGWVAFHVIRIRRHVVLTNLRLAFPELTERERAGLAERHYRSLALGILEVARCWWRPVSDLPAHRIEGLEHLERAKALGKGVILLSGHFTTLEITGRMLSLRMGLCCLYRDPNNAAVGDLLRRHRTAWTRRAIPMDALKELVRALREGEIVWYAPDQGRWTAQSALLPFMGHPAITNTSTSRLAAMTGAAVMSFYARREDDGSYTLRISPPLDTFPTGDPEADTRRLVSDLEDAVRAAPEQYLWVHRRFKRRRGELSPYDR